jgi:thiol-disulfide isomerase/thioredoxin
MANIITYVNILLRPYYTIIISIFLFIFFLGIARYAYDRYFSKTIENKKYSDVANIPDRKPVIMIFFFSVDWCPHCLKAKPEWNNFKQQYSDKVVNGYVIKTYDIDCTDDNGDEVIIYNDDDGNQTTTKPTSMKTAEIIRKYKIESYPTIKLVKDGVTVDYDAKVTSESLTKFIKSV